MQYQRQTAYKVWIADLLKGDVQKESGEFGINYILINDKRVSRVNLMGFIVERYYNELNHIYFVIDDKSGRIKIKVWNEDVNLFRKIDIGDFVLVIGKIKSTNERYIVPEIMKILDNPLWGRLRHAELTRMYGKPVRDDSVIGIKEDVDSDHGANMRQRILNAIERFDDGMGCSFDDLLNLVNGDEVNMGDVIDILIKEGEIFKIGERFKLAG